MYKDEVSLITFGNNKLKTVSSIITECYVKGVRYNMKFILVDFDSIPIPGLLNSCVKLNLL